jgi:hypothetical protein
MISTSSRCRRGPSSVPSGRPRTSSARARVACARHNRRGCPGVHACA